MVFFVVVVVVVVVLLLLYIFMDQLPELVPRVTIVCRSLVCRKLLLVSFCYQIIRLPPLSSPLDIVRRSKTTPFDLSTPLSC